MMWVKWRNDSGNVPQWRLKPRDSPDFSGRPDFLDVQKFEQAVHTSQDVQTFMDVQKFQPRLAPGMTDQLAIARSRLIY